MRFLDLLFAARPLLHIPHWSVYLVALHFHHRLSGASFDILDAATMLGITLLASSALYLNQIYDFISDRLNDKLPHIVRSLVSVAQLRTSFLVAGVLGMLLGLLISLPTALVFAQLFLFSYTYSAPPWRFKDKPFAGFFANAYGYGFLVSLSVMQDLSSHSMGLLGWDNPFYFLLAVGGIYLLTTLLDIEGDKFAGKRTLALLFGSRVTTLFATVCFAGAAYIAWRTRYDPLVAIAVVSAVLSLLSAMRVDRVMLQIAIKSPIVLLTALAGFWYPVYGVFVVLLVLGTAVYFRQRLGIRYPTVS